MGKKRIKHLGNKKRRYFSNGLLRGKGGKSALSRASANDKKSA